MNHSSASLLKTRSARNCRNLRISSRVRREVMADRLDAQWQELRRHATVERDPEKLLRLTAEISKSRRQSDVWGKRKGS